MSELEDRLRASFAHQVADVPVTGLLGEVAVRRGRRQVKRRRLTSAAVALALVAGAGAMLTVKPFGDQRSTLSAKPMATTASPSSPPSTTRQTRPLASRDWAAGLVVPPQPREWFAVVGDVASASPPGPTGMVLTRTEQHAALEELGPRTVQVTVVPTGWVVTAYAARQQPTTSFWRAGETRPVWRVAGTSYGHAVDETGTAVAFSVNRARTALGVRQVRSVPTGAVQTTWTATTPNGHGSPVAWIGDQVLVRAGDGAGGHADLWTPATGANRTIGPSVYGGAADLRGERVALYQNDGPCTGVSRLTQPGDDFAECRGEAQFDRDGERVLFWGDGGASVRTTSGGRLPVELPDRGVLAAGWDGPAIVAVVADEDDSTYVVRCTTDGLPCERLDRTDGAATYATVARTISP